MSNNDLIRRGDAIAALTKVAVRVGITGEPQIMILAKEALRALPAAQVTVKPLEFSPHLDISGLYEAASPIGWFYSIWDLGDGRFSYDGDPPKVSANSPGEILPTIEAAKAVAQADYEARILSSLAVQSSPDEHYDDYCIRQFAKMMSEKMAASRAKGRSGWNDPEKCSVEYLRSLLYEHLDKGDPVDVANFCMMMRHYEASTYREAGNCQPQPSPDVMTLVETLDKTTAHGQRIDYSRVGHSLSDASWHVHLAGFRSQDDAEAFLSAALAKMKGGAARALAAQEGGE